MGEIRELPHSTVAPPLVAIDDARPLVLKRLEAMMRAHKNLR